MRTRKIMKWAGACFSATILAAWIFSFWGSVTYSAKSVDMSLETGTFVLDILHGSKRDIELYSNNTDSSGFDFYVGYGCCRTGGPISNAFVMPQSFESEVAECDDEVENNDKGDTAANSGTLTSRIVILPLWMFFVTTM